MMSRCDHSNISSAIEISRAVVYVKGLEWKVKKPPTYASFVIELLLNKQSYSDTPASRSA